MPAEHFILEVAVPNADSLGLELIAHQCLSPKQLH